MPAIAKTDRNNVLSVYLDPELKVNLKQLCEREDITLSQAVRKATREWVAKQSA